MSRSTISGAGVINDDVISVYDAQTTASGTHRRRPPWYVSDRVASWNSVEHDDIRVIIDDPHLANSHDVEIVRFVISCSNGPLLTIDRALMKPCFISGPGLVSMPDITSSSAMSSDDKCNPVQKRRSSLLSAATW